MVMQQLKFRLLTRKYNLHNRKMEGGSEVLGVNVSCVNRLSGSLKIFIGYQAIN